MYFFAALVPSVLFALSTTGGDTSTHRTNSSATPQVESRLIQYSDIVCHADTDPHGPDPHGSDPHDEIHDNNLPANATPLPANRDPAIFDSYLKQKQEDAKQRDPRNR